MKLGSGRITAIAAGVLVLGTLTGVTGAVPASAASWTNLCAAGIGTSGCIIADGSENPVFLYEVDPSVSITNWVYPSTNGASGEIQQANTDLCLQLDASGGYPDAPDDGVNIVREAPCNGDLAEQWVNTYNSYYGATEFVSEWASQNGSDANSGTVCLGASFAENYVFIGPCDANGSFWNAEWVS